MQGHERNEFVPVSDDNKHAADEIEAVVHTASSIEEEMMLEAADLEEIESGGLQPTAE